MYECFLDYENITNICFGYDSQSHKFDTCTLNSKGIGMRIENFQESFHIDESMDCKKEDKNETQDAYWVEIRLRRPPSAFRNSGKNTSKTDKKGNEMNKFTTEIDIAGQKDTRMTSRKTRWDHEAPYINVPASNTSETHYQSSKSHQQPKKNNSQFRD